MSDLFGEIILDEAKNPSVVAIVGHTDCAGNPVSDEDHYADVRTAKKTIQSWGFGGRVVGFVAERGETDGEWTLNECE